MRTCPCCSASLAVLCRYDEPPPVDSTGYGGLHLPRGRPPAGGHARLAALESEQAPLSVEPARVSTQASVGRDDAVTGHDDRDGVRAEGSAGGARGLLVAGLSRDGAVRRHLPVGDLGGRGEDASLERRERREIEVDVERTPAAGEVLIELDLDAIAAPAIGQHSGPVCARDAPELALVGLAVVDGDDPAGSDGDPERAERRIHRVVADGDEILSTRPCDQALASFAHQWFEGHRMASLSFFMASATRDRAASSLQPSVSAISWYGRPSIFRSTNAARCPPGSKRIAFRRSARVTPSRSGAASRKSASDTSPRCFRARSIALFVAIL